MWAPERVGVDPLWGDVCSLGIFHFKMRLAEMIYIQVPGIVLTNVMFPFLLSLLPHLK